MGNYLPNESRGPEDRLRERAAEVNKSIRKVGKAHWEFRCGMCGAHGSGVDQWSVYEFGWNHNRDAASEHFFAAVSSAMDTLASAFNSMLKPVSEALSTMEQTFAEPMNLPHDPTLLKDKRKWGGR